MGRVVKRGKRHCIQNTANLKIGRCFSKKKKAKRELAKLRRAMRNR